MKKILLSCLFLMLVMLVGYAQSPRKTTNPSPVGNDGKPCSVAATVTDIDNNTYNSVQIGNQCWMKENLRTTHYANGVRIPLGSTYSYSEPYRYIPGNNPSIVPSYGYLYNWRAVMNNTFSSNKDSNVVQGICPTNWHVPSDAEWTKLTDYLSTQSQYVCDSIFGNIAKALASTTGWSINSNTCVVGNNLSFNNTTGFSAFPAGSWYGEYDDFGHYAYFWSATGDIGSYAFSWSLCYGYANMGRSSFLKGYGFSVRCVRD